MKTMHRICFESGHVVSVNAESIEEAVNTAIKRQIAVGQPIELTGNGSRWDYDRNQFEPIITKQS